MGAGSSTDDSVGHPIDVVSDLPFPLVACDIDGTLGLNATAVSTRTQLLLRQVNASATDTIVRGYTLDPAIAQRIVPSSAVCFLTSRSPWKRDSSLATSLLSSRRSATTGRPSRRGRRTHRLPDGQIARTPPRSYGHHPSSRDAQGRDIDCALAPAQRGPTRPTDLPSASEAAAIWRTAADHRSPRSTVQSQVRALELHGASPKR